MGNINSIGEKKKYDMNTKLSTEVAELSERNNVCEFEKKNEPGGSGDCLSDSSCPLVSA